MLCLPAWVYSAVSYTHLDVYKRQLLSSAITFVLLLPLMRHQPLRWDWGFLRKMIRYSWPLVIVGFAGVINQYSSIAFQKYLLPGDTSSNLSDGGIYAAAASLAILMSLFTTAFNYAAEPFFLSLIHI